MDDDSRQLDMAFYLKMKNSKHYNEMIKKLSQSGASSVNLFYDDETI